MPKHRTIVPWPGGKSRLARFILDRMPEHDCYVEAFAGGAGILFARPEPARVEVLNDINSELVNLYRCVQHHLEEFVRQFRWSLVSRQMYEWAKLQDPATLTDIQRAARFFYLQKLGFGARVHGRTYGYGATTKPRLNLLRLEEDLSQAHLRLARVHVECLPWLDCCRRYDRPQTLHYLDPPYWQLAGYGVPFPFEEYQRMADFMRGAKGKVLVSINDHPDIRQAFAGLDMEEIAIKYTAGRANGERAESRELLIRSW